MQCRLLECFQQPDVQWQEAGPAFCQAGAYMISGGLGSLGLLVTQWLTLSQPSQASLVNSSTPTWNLQLEALLLCGMSVEMSLRNVSAEEKGIKRAQACSNITPCVRLKGSLRVLRPFPFLQLSFSWAEGKLILIWLIDFHGARACSESAEI